MLNWYISRLRTMTAFEVVYRIRCFIQSKFEQIFVRNTQLSPVKYNTSINILDIRDLSDRGLVFNGIIDIFSCSFDYGKDKIDWHKDIVSGKSFPLVFGKSINIRNDSQLSAKNVWEVNRLQFLVQIAYNYRKTNDAKYLKQFIDIMKSWIDKNPYLQGINWYSNLEINIRLINWFFCWEILNVEQISDYEFKEFVNEKWAPIIYKHCKYSSSNLSRFSSANNHLISEYSGLYIAAKKWQFKESLRWLKKSKSGLETEISKQHSNGINKEEAAEYIQFITDFFLIPFRIGEKTQDSFSKDYITNLKKIFNYIYNFTDIKGNFPRYGDDDDGKVLCLSGESADNNFKSLMISAAIIFNDSKYLNKVNNFDLKNEILFGDKGRSFLNATTDINEVQGSCFYKEEGHFIFRKQFRNKEIYCHFNAAPLGYLSIAAHGHADALSFSLNINGEPIFIDPGTYTYHVSKEWRNYFVSTKAHNTICIDDTNQASHVADTMWRNHYNSEVFKALKENDKEQVIASHSGYIGVQHIREFIFERSKEEIIIHDTVNVLDGEFHTIFIPFHLSPDIVISRESDNKFCLTNSDQTCVYLTLDDILDPIITNGSLDPILGWNSESFLKKTPSPVIHAEIKTNKNILLITKIKIHEY